MECIHSGGKKRVLCLLFEGIPVGEDKCLFGGPREYRAVAVTACQIFRIPAEVFKRRAEASPALALKLFRIFRPEEPGAWPHADPRQLVSVRGRVIQFLLSVSEPYGTEEGAGGRLTIRLTRQEVADFIGHLPGGGVECFQSLSREGLLKKTRQHYPIPTVPPWRPSSIHNMAPAAGKTPAAGAMLRLCPPRSIYANSPVER